MPRYFFHLEDDLYGRDDEGMEMDNVAVAKCEAVKLAGRIIGESASSFWDKEEWKLTAADENGLTLFCLHLVGLESPAARAHNPI